MIVPMLGDILDSVAPVLVDPVNCVGVAGAGLALAFRRRHPEAHRVYLRACETGALAPGRLASADGLFRTIVFFPTKRHWRDPSRLEDVAAGLGALRALILERGWMHVAVPALGCGLGDLPWSSVQYLIHANLDDLQGVFEVYAPH